MKKILSDGTIAKKGMIVVVSENTDMCGNYPNTITKIVRLKTTSDGDGEDCYPAVRCLWVGKEPNWLNEGCEFLRKATPEEELTFNSR
jgi:hypothetical protein